MKQLVCLVVVGACMFACHKPPSLPLYQPPIAADMQATDEFAWTLAVIGRQVKELGVPDQLFGSESFNRIYANPQNYLAAALSVLARKDIAAHEKKITCYAMQKLPAEQFVGLVATLADNVAQGQIEVDLLETMAFAPLNFGSQPLILYYQNPTVQKLLTRLLGISKLSATNRKYIRDDLLTGRDVSPVMIAIRPQPGQNHGGGKA